MKQFVVFSFQGTLFSPFKVRYSISKIFTAKRSSEIPGIERFLVGMEGGVTRKRSTSEIGTKRKEEW